jgi:hypothetical protein
MQWRVVKLGIEQFDILHAYGLAILLATACGVPVTLQDTAYCYTLSCPEVELPRVHATPLLESALPLPDEEELRQCDPRAQQQKLPVTVLDGLLAALFTTPGLRALSVSDLLGKQRLDAEALAKGLHKVAKTISRWKAFARRTARRQGTDWLNNVLRDYNPERPAFPILVEGKYEGDINVLMTIDPSFCFSLRSTQSLGRMTEKTQVAVRGTRYAGLLAFIGASRFLRAQRLCGSVVNYYVPTARTLSINAESSLPLLFPADEKPDQAALGRWLALSQQGLRPEAVWRGLAYQTLLTQGQQQSLSVESGILECGWLLALQGCHGGDVLAFWQTQLHATKGTHDEQESLLNCLMRRSAGAWFAHLQLITQSIHTNTAYTGRCYSLEEVRKITEAMNDTAHMPLKQVLEREKGTLRFGRALRQVGRYNPSRLRDLLDELQDARTDAQLLPVLHHIVFASEVEKAKKRRIIVPDEDDCAALLEDMDRYGVPVLVGLLMVLSALHYPHSDESLKYELSTLIRALLALAAQIATPTEPEDKSALHAHELFIDDPEILSGGSLEEQEEI